MMSRSVCRHFWHREGLSTSKKFFSGSAALSAEPDPSVSLVGRDFLSLRHFRGDEIKQILWTAKDLKTRIKDNGEVFQPLEGKTAAMIFHRMSKRTRLSAELGLARLGGSAVGLGQEIAQHDVEESVRDTARTLAAMADVIVASVPDQEVLRTVADESNVPVINGASDLLHPLQTLALFMTIQEDFGYLRGSQVSWIGDSNSVLHSLMHGCARLGIDLNIATPVGYEPDGDITIEAIKIAGKTGASIQMTNNPVEAAYRADVVVTDTWFRSGTGKADKDKKLGDFQDYKVNRKMLKEAGGNWVFMHCLPHAQEEVTDDLFYSDESLVWQLVENRMWTIMSLMLNQLQVYTPTIPMPKYVRG